MALKKVFICPWFGPMPEWMDLYWECAEKQGFDWLVDDDLDSFRERVRRVLQIDAPIVYGEAKVHDYRPALGLLYEEEIQGYDFWGHTDFDCVYGRLDHFYPDEYLAHLDTYSDHPSYMAGPFSLYRNTPDLAHFFLRCDDWRVRLTQPETTGWVEASFTDALRLADLRSVFRLTHGWRNPAVIRWDENRLMEKAREIPFFHFRYTKEWPL